MGSGHSPDFVIAYEKIPAAAKDVCKRLHDAGFEAYLVGGGVRDVLLGRPVGDWDVATSARPEDVQRVFRKVIPTGIKHGTVTVIVKGGTLEVTTYRTEQGYSDARRPDAVTFVASLNEDLARRDFTINAMAIDPVAKKFVDPLHGVNDLHRRVLRTVGSAAERFGEDALRPLRAARFAAVLEFSVDDELMRAIPGVLDAVDRVSKERIRDEMLRLLAAKKPSVGLRMMRETGLLGRVLPELTDAKSEIKFEQCDRLSLTDPLLRLALLIVDEQGDRAVVAEKVAERWRLSTEQRKQLVHAVAQGNFAITPDDDAGIRRWLAVAGTENVTALIAMRRARLAADDHARQTLFAEFDRRVAAVLKAKPPLRLSDLAVDGDDLCTALDRKPGPWLGKLLQSLHQDVLGDPSLNTRRNLLSLATKYTAP